MKKLSTLILALLCLVSASAQTITASDLDFGTVSIKGQTELMMDLPVDVTISSGFFPYQGYIMAEISEDATGDCTFYIVDSYNGVGSIEFFPKYDNYTNPFNIGFYATAPGTYTGKARFYGYGAPSWDEVETFINLKVTVTGDAIVQKTVSYERVQTTSGLKVGDVVLFVDETTGSVSGDIYQTYLTAVTEGVTIDAQTGKAEVPEEMAAFALSKYNGNWQLTNTKTGERLLLDVSGKGAFSYGETDKEHLAGWGISITDGEAYVARPSDESFPVYYNSERFKPYNNAPGNGRLPSLYKKVSNSHEVQSSLSISPSTIDLGAAKLSEKKSIELTYTAQNLTDDILWDIDGADAQLFELTESGDRESGTLTITYLGTATKTGKVSASLIYLTQDVSLEAMEGSFPINLVIADEVVSLESIEFDSKSYDLALGQTLGLAQHVTLLPANAGDKSLTWQSGNTAVAVVDASGIVKPLKEGKTTITVTSVAVPAVKATCEVNVVLPAAESIELSAVELTLMVGESAQLIAHIMPTDANQAVSFTSDNAQVAAVDKDGNIVAKAEGTAVITVTAESDANIFAKCSVTVIKPEPTEATPAPVFSIEEGEVTRGTELVISAERPDDRLFVRIDGEEGEWEEYEGHCHYNIDRDLTIEAYVERDGFLPSETVSKTYTVRVEDAVESVDANRGAARKVLRDGHLLILLPDGTTYTATGAKLN